MLRPSHRSGGRPNLRFLSTASLLCCILCGVSSAQKSQPYISKREKLAFTLPPGWVKKSESDLGATFVPPGRKHEAPVRTDRPETDAEFLARLKKTSASPVSSTVSATLALQIQPAGKATLDEHSRRSRLQTRRTEGFSIRTQRRTTLAGEPAYERTVRFRSPGQPTLMLRELTCVHEGKLISLILSSPEESFKALSAHFERVALSFMWTR